MLGLKINEPEKTKPTPGDSRRDFQILKMCSECKGHNLRKIANCRATWCKSYLERGIDATVEVPLHRTPKRGTRTIGPEIPQKRRHR